MPAEICLHCGRNAHEAPLIPIHYRDEIHWICPQHLPILIHQPARLADKLPGVENLAPPEGHHHD